MFEPSTGPHENAPTFIRGFGGTHKFIEHFNYLVTTKLDSVTARE